MEKYGTARQATDDNIIRRMRFACPITKATDTHLEYVILIAFAQQQWLRECSSLLRLYVQCMSCYLIIPFSVHSCQISASRYPISIDTNLLVLLRPNKTIILSENYSLSLPAGLFNVLKYPFKQPPT